MNLRFGSALAVALAVTAVVAARPADARVPHPAPGPAITTAVLTPDGTDAYWYTSVGGAITVTAPRANRGGNLREVWWSTRSAPGRDQQTCVTWTRSGGPIAQAGLALRATGRTGALQVITVTNNIWSGARSGWNVHTWRTDTGQHRIVGQVRLARVFGAVPINEPDLPWRVCARVIWQSLELKAWPLSDPRGEPAWGDPVYGTTLELPRDWVHAGQPGWYVGHLRPGEQMGYRDMSVAPVRLDGGESMAVRLRASTSTLYRSLVGPAVGGVGRLGVPLPPRVTPAS